MKFDQSKSQFKDVDKKTFKSFCDLIEWFVGRVESFPTPSVVDESGRPLSAREVEAFTQGWSKGTGIAAVVAGYFLGGDAEVDGMSSEKLRDLQDGPSSKARFN